MGQVSSVPSPHGRIFEVRGFSWVKTWVCALLLMPHSLQGRPPRFVVFREVGGTEENTNQNTLIAKCVFTEPIHCLGLAILTVFTEEQRDYKKLCV